MIAAGELDRRIQFERATAKDDDYATVDEWGPHGSPIWARKRDISDGERAKAGGVAATLVARFLVRSTPFTRGLTPSDRLKEKGETFAISGIKEVGRLSALEITASAWLENE